MIDNKLRITAGNTFATAHTITAQDVQGQPIPDFDLQECTDIQVYARNGGSYKPVTSWQLDDQSVVVLWYGKQMKLGGYDFYIAGKFGGADWRTSEATIFEIVQYNEEANIPADTIVVDGTYFLDASFSLITEIQGGGGGATPSDDLPLMDGTADAGTSAKYSRGDHRHPSDTNKQDVIADLSTIRSGAAAGATAVQPAALSGYQPLIDNDNKLDYSLLDNTPTIPAAQVNSDWNANSGVAQILNKPTIPAAQVQSDWNEEDNTKADYIKNKPTIPAAQVQSDWNEANNTKADYIKNKPTIPSVVDSLSSASTTSALSANQGKVLNESKQATIDATHKLGADLVDDTATTHKFVTSADITKWNKAAIVADADGQASEAGFDAYADTVWNKQQTLSSAQKVQARANIEAQEILVSGSNIKTINNESILGTGNITIQGGSGEANVIESISINGTAQTVTSKNVDLPVPTSSDVYSIVKKTQAQYDALATKDSSTLYIIVES